MTPYIAYQNLFQSASMVKASSEAEGYDGANAYDDRTYDFWKPASAGTHTLIATFASKQSVNYFGVAAHDLADDESSIKLEYSTDGTIWYDAVESWSPADNRVIFRVFEGVSAAHWRVSVTSTGYPSMGVLAFGAALKLPVGMRTGFKPPHLNRNTKYLNNVSAGGQFLGRSLLRSGNDGVIDLSFLPTTWVQMAWPTLSLALETKPFFFCWDYERFSINKLSFSENIGAAWYDIPPHGVPRMYNRVVFLPNSDVAPDGSLTADTIEDSRSLGYSQISQQQPLLSETDSQVFSVYVKKDGIPRTTRFMTIGLTFWIGDLSKTHWCNLDTATGEISAGGYSSASNIAVVSLGDYWRISVHGSPRDVYGPSASDGESADPPLSVEVGVHPAFGAGAQWQGDPGTRGSCVIWGLQLETGTVPSDYIKTADGPASNEAEAVFAWTDGKITNPSYSHAKYMTASIPFRCISGV